MKTIKDMPAHSRPREKLREKGASALTDEELVAAILGNGKGKYSYHFYTGNIPQKGYAVQMASGYSTPYIT